jgi:uncharacterized membrane protein
MTALLDPIWPWDRLWAVFLSMPGTDRAVTLLAAAAAGALPALLLARPGWRRPAPLALAGLLAWGGVLLARYGSLAEALPLMLLLYGPPALAGLALGSYLGAARGASVRVPQRLVLAVLALRALGLLLALTAIARPAFAWEERAEARSAVWVLIDSSRSMSILDEDGSQSRWARVWAAFSEARPLLERLRSQAGIDFRFYRFAESAGDLDPDNPGEPDGKATHVGSALRDLMELRDPLRPPRMLLAFSDGANNGVEPPALAEASRWRQLPCPIHTFSVGRTNTTSRQDDVAITSISTSPQPYVPVSGKLAVRVTIDAHGYEGSPAVLKMFLEAPDEKGAVAEREVASRQIRLPLRVGNEEEVTVDAPSVPCEARVRVTVETKEPDRLPLNNVIETFVTVSRDSALVLLVDRPRWEARFIHDALASDPRLRVTSVNVFGAGGGKLPIDAQPYDAIILGDVSASEVEAIDKDAIPRLVKMVERGAGLLMTGGHRNFNAGGWDRTPLGALLPAEQDTAVEQVKGSVIVEPQPEGLRLAKYLFDLKGEPDILGAWKKLAKLEQGHTALKVRGENRTVLARAGESPVLIAGTHGKSRVLAFAADTTHDWRNTEEGLPLFERFWRRVAIWLARQEDAEGGPWVKPLARRIPVRSDLSFQCGVRARGGGEDLAAKLQAEVFSPSGAKAQVALSRGKDESHGLFQATRAPGTYRVVARSGGAEASARVIVYDEDVEMAQPAADLDFLARLASEGGGDAYKAGALKELLARLAEQPASAAEVTRVTSPNWRTEERSGFLAAFLALFCVVMSLEWALRRWWGMA